MSKVLHSENTSLILTGDFPTVAHNCHGKTKSHGTTNLTHGKTVLSDGKTKLIHGSTQLIHGKTKLTHGRTPMLVKQDQNVEE